MRLTRETGTDNYICALDGASHAYFRRVMKPALSREAAAPFVQDMIEMVEAKAHSLQEGGVISVYGLPATPISKSWRSSGNTFSH
jgi:cytochrome P450